VRAVGQWKFDDEDRLGFAGAIAEVIREAFAKGDDVESLVIASGWEFAPGWDWRRVLKRVYENNSYVLSNKEMPPERRRHIARLAFDLREKVVGLKWMGSEFNDILRKLAGEEGGRQITRPVRTGRGGDRRSGERTAKGSALGQIVRLYIEAHAKPAFSTNGPLVRFANGIGELVLQEPKPFTSDAVKAEFRRQRATSGVWQIG
jgi:hypothetical protein